MGKGMQPGGDPMTCNEFKLWFQDHELDEMTGAIRSHLAVCDR